MKNFVQKPVLLLVSGPAGSGKTTLCDRLTAEFPEEIARAITCTTRAPRAGEVDGVDYFFLSHAAFEAGLAAGDFLEHARVHSNHYGVRREQVESILGCGKNALLNLDVQGAATVRKLAKTHKIIADALVSVFIMPPSVEDLRARLVGRGTDVPEEIERRLRVALDEITRWGEYDFCLVSGTREADFARLQAIYAAAKMRT